VDDLANGHGGRVAGEREQNAVSKFLLVFSIELRATLRATSPGQY
jgi:hypothetical protein